MRIYFPAVFFFFLVIPGFSKERIQNEELIALLDSGEYFFFHDRYKSSEQTLNEIDKLVFGAYDESYFGDAAYSNRLIDSLIFHYDCSDTLAMELLSLGMENSFRLFQYENAFQYGIMLQMQYGGLMTREELENVRNFVDIAAGLKEVPPQTVVRNGDLNVKYKRDIAQLMRIPVYVNAVPGDFIVDTGANLSTVIESEAKRMRIRVLDVGLGVVSSSRSSVAAKIGIADTLAIGNAVFYHVVFIVFPDEALRFFGGLYKIKGIIGMPVLGQLGEIQITKKGRFISPLTQTNSAVRNLGFSGNTVFLNASFYGKAHPYIFDTGAGAGIFNVKFYNAYHDKLESPKRKTSRIGGAGGIQQVEIIYFKNLPYAIGEKSGTLKRSTIQVGTNSMELGNFYGIIGEDIITQWDEIIVNFDKRFLVFN
jgi:predicted aspartyl protease